MRFKLAATLAALALLALASAHARVRTQQQGQGDDKVVDEFVQTRGILFDVPAKTGAKAKPGTRRRPAASVAKAKPQGGAKQGGGPSDVAGQKAQPAANGAASDAAAAEEGVQVIKTSTLPALGLGYSIYVRDEETGGLLPAGAGRTYRTGDAIFMVLEPSADGYLYVFNAENGKDPVMIYPNVQLRDGANDVRAHMRETYPDDPEAPFRFEDPPADEHVYIVLTREPLAGLPTGAALRKFCGKNVRDCEPRPTAAQWERILAGALGGGVREWRGQIAQADAQPVMPVMLQRGIRVKRDAPKPMTVRVSKSPDAPMVVTKIVLLHK
jgi:hypothetical protein